MFKVINVLGYKYIYLPYLQLILEYDDELLLLEKEIQRGKLTTSNHKNVKDILHKNIYAKKQLKKQVSNYFNKEGLNLKACQLNIIHQCNLACKYCFAGDGTHNKKGALSKENVISILDFIKENKDPSNKINITLIGGEPLMNIPTLEEVVSQSKKNYSKDNISVKHSITTNGTLFDDRVMNFLNQNKVEFMVSLDSDSDSEHDYLRSFKNSKKSSYRVIMDNYEKYKDKNSFDSFHVTVTPFNKKISKIADKLYDMGSQHLHFSEVISEKDEFKFSKEDIEILEKEYEKLAVNLVERIYADEKISCYPLMRNLGRIHGRKHLKLKCGALNGLVAIDSDGMLYPCDMLMWEEYKLGSVKEGIDYIRLNELKNKMIEESRCNDCWARYLCGGECLSEILWDDMEQKNLRCRLKKHIVKLQLHIYYEIIKGKPDFEFEKFQY